MIALPVMSMWRWAPVWPQPAPRHASMLQCLVLAALLHALLIVLFGSTQGGTARPGEGVWGAINVTLRGLPDKAGARQPPEDAHSGPVGSARERRFGGAVRDEAQAPRTNDGPGAARLGVWSSTPSERAEEVTPGVASKAIDAPRALTAAGDSPPGQTAPLARTLPGAPQLQPAAPSAPADAQPAPEARSAPLAESPTPSRAERVAPRAAESRPAETPRAAPSEAESRLKMVESTPLPAAPAAQPSPAMPSPDAGVVAPTPLLREAPREAVREPRVLAPLAASAPPRSAERLPSVPTPPVALPALAETPRAPPISQLPAPVELRAVPALPGTAPAQREAAPRSEPASLPALATTPTAPSLPVELAPDKSLSAPVARSAPARLEPVESVQRMTGAPVMPAVPSVAAMPAAPGPPGPSAPAATPTATPGTPAAPATANRPPGTPDAGSQVGRDVATPPGQAASTPPRLNLELARPRGGEIARDAPKSVLNLVPPPPERKNKLATDIEQSAKKDCRTAYAGLGLLAPLGVAVDVARDKLCKW